MKSSAKNTMPMGKPEVDLWFLGKATLKQQFIGLIQEYLMSLLEMSK